MSDNDSGPSSVLLTGARTPVGRFRGALGSMSATDLGAVAIRAAVERSTIPVERIEYVVMGQVVTAGAGQNPARIAAAGAGIPMNVPAVTVNNVCLSGINSIVLADQMIRSGDYDVVVAGGMESMSQAPHLLPPVVNFGDIVVHDALERDGLWDHFTDQTMGALTDAANIAEFGVDRTDQDLFAVASHLRAALAWESGVFADEVVPVRVPMRRGGHSIVTTDEGVRPDAGPDALAKLSPSFDPAGTITAATSSPLSDGAAAVVVTSRRFAEESGLGWLAEITGHATVAGPDSSLQHQPAAAIEQACRKVGCHPKDLDLLEINEAFAAVGIASTRRLGIDPARVNVHGGALALGHPLGMSGTRVALHLAVALAQRGGGRGAAALCGGGGQGEALLLTAPTRT